MERFGYSSCTNIQIFCLQKSSNLICNVRSDDKEMRISASCKNNSFENKLSIISRNT